MPSLPRRTLGGLAALGAVALIAGCGGGSDSLSAEEFRSQADAVCADAERQIDDLTEPRSGEQVLAFLRAGLPIQEAQLERLREIEPPDDLRSDYDEGMDLLEQQIAAIDAAADRIEAGEDPEAVLGEVDEEISSLGDEADERARALGLTVCGADDDDAATTTGTTPTAPTAPATTTPGAGGGESAAYLADVQAAAGALQEFGTLLQSTTGLEDLRSKIPAAQASLDTFDSAIAELDGYTLDEAQLEQQRAGLARTGPAVSDVLRRFLDAAQEGDLQAVQALVPEVTSTIGEFQAAATGD
jgi:soluble cytochrome b562